MVKNGQNASFSNNTPPPPRTPSQHAATQQQGFDVFAQDFKDLSYESTQ
jgi:hypothetical protein